MAESLDVGTLSGRVELEDKFGPQVAEIANKLDLLNDRMKSSHGHALEVAEGFVGAEAAMKVAELTVDAVKAGLEKLWDVAIKGSHAADIEGTFERMTEQAGIAGDTLKGKLSDALHGTVNDAELMVRVNQNMAAGLKLTTDQASVLAKGAYALAKATGGDAATALDTLSTAMVTGRTRSVALLTGKIDLAQAESNFATKLGVSVDRLSEEGKLQAVQEVILQRVGDATARVGDQQERFADKVQQTRAQLQNLEDQVGIAIATSPVLATGFDEVKKALTEAFGGNQATLVKTIAQTVDDLAIGVLGLAEYVTDGVGIIGIAWNEGIILMDSVRAGWAAIAYVAESALLAIEKGINTISFGALDDQVKTLSEDTDHWYNTMAENVNGINAHKKAEDEWAVSTGKVKDKIEEIRQKMIAAKDATHDYAEPIRDVTKGHNDAAAAADKNSQAEDKNRLILGQTKEEAKKYAEALREMAFVAGDWKVVLDGISGDTVNAVKFYLDAGVALDKLAAAYGLTDTQAKAIEKDWKEGNETTKETLKAIGELTKGWEAYYAELASLSENDVKKTKSTALDKYLAISEKLQEAGDEDVSHYDNAWKLYEADVKKNEQALILKDEHSKAYVNKQLNDARDMYQFMLQNSDQYSDEERSNQRKQVEALEKTRDTWGQVGNSIDKDTEKVRTLSGEVLTLKEYESRQLSGGSFEISKNVFDQMISSFHLADSGRAYQMAAAGYSFGEIVQYNQLQGALPAPHGPRIPGFEGGGVGDFGAGTLAMLHGHEAIIPLDGPSARGGVGGNVHIDSIVLQYPIMNDPRAMEQLGNVFGDAVLLRMKRSGYRVS